MSHWDFGRRPDAEPDARPPAEPSDTACQPGPVPGADDAWAARDGWAPGDVPTVETPQPAESTWPAETLWEADERWTAGEGWPLSADASPGDGWASGDAWEDEDEGTAPYPLTYERDDLAAAPPLPPPTAPLSPSPPARPAPPPDAPWGPWPSAPYPVSHEAPGVPAASFGQDAGPGAGAGAQRDDLWRAGFAGLGRPDAEGARWPGTAPGPDEFPGDWAGHGGPYARHGGRRWLVLAGVVAAGAAVGAAAVLVANGSPGGQASPAAGRGGQQSGAAAPPVTPAARASASASASSPAPPLTPAQAKAVLAGYTTVNNSANAKRSATLLATVEAGSSYAIDAGLYRVQQGTAPFPAFGPARATYYIPHNQQAAGPRWFVVQVANAFSASPATVTSNEYLLFTQQVPGGPWQDAVEPYLIAGASAPRIAVGADGLATAVSLDTLAVAAEPSQLPAATAAALNGTGNTPGQPAVHAPGNLADVGDQEFWAGKLPDGKVTDVHTAAAGAAGQEFALQTADGGALVFYTDAARVTLTPPAGTMLHLTVPGFYSPAQRLSRAAMSYLEQFATYDPPAGAGQAPSVVADYSGITGKN